MSTPRPPVPLSFFSIPVGLLAFANTWHVGVRLWHLPADVAQALDACRAWPSWAVLLVLYARKWVAQRAEARRRAAASGAVAVRGAGAGREHAGGAGVDVRGRARSREGAVRASRWSRSWRVGLWLNGRLWMGGRPPELVTPAIYLPSVAQSFVAADGVGRVRLDAAGHAVVRRRPARVARDGIDHPAARRRSARRCRRRCARCWASSWRPRWWAAAAGCR